MTGPPPPRVFIDASPLIALARINRLDLLTMLPGPRGVTALVWAEVTGQSRPGVDDLHVARQDGLFGIVSMGDPRAYPQLDAGEASTLSAAAQVGAAVVVDERKARRLLRTDPLLVAAIPSHISTVGLIVLAKRRGRITGVRSLLDELRRETFRISHTLYEEALRAAGEWPPT